MLNNYCPTCQHEQNSIGFCDKCLYSRLLEEKGIAPTMYERRPTNADRIRQMSDEELAEFLMFVEHRFSEFDRRTWLDWLKQEVDNGESN